MVSDTLGNDKQETVLHQHDNLVRHSFDVSKFYNFLLLSK